ncbi:Sterol desaturase/sphingolipid hydroxylase, fatty acid hydroxylase superfamily [Tenacibaculum sp. MAR_2010_89]|uniref:sterol desaturase family protein n=1 Tax=Tenacibaculum sp. MAR_2010_89 TaxID=1250198 RepID=UPI000898D3D5|nr:sterol desaturase family protein [Tenacibaculum sp. MAR_2010_89]SED94603.1 Sterol desaturase/sphingolipid hydroxylase, fatty acid hydroxylase superfamily [Tenacibaculum sp. MAR_2010_89]
MNKYLEIIKNSYTGYWNYLKQSVFFELNWENYFYGLILISFVVWGLELIFPWRKKQPIFRKDFWLDIFYMFFNFFILNLIVLIALSNTSEQLLNDFLSIFNLSVSSFQLFEINSLHYILRLFIFFIIIDFIQWFTHTLLHKYEFLWNFHKVHHSVKEMGFAAHLRYHWMEPVVYNSMKYIPLAIMGGFTAKDVAIIHFFNITIGHLNHANINWDYGFLKYILNNPKMHIWHHAKELPKERKKGVNFGITLSIWDYLFKTNYIPHNGRDIEIGFEGDDTFPKDFISQELYPLKK